MKINNHFTISMIKSALRIGGFLLLVNYFNLGIMILVVAELIGIIEEMVV